MASVSAVAARVDVPEEVVLALFEAIVELAKDGDRVFVRNFGSFFVRRRKPRLITSPKLPGGQARVQAIPVLVFRPSPKLSRILRGRARGVARKYIEAAQ